MGDLAHGCAGRLAHHGDQVVVLPDAVDVEAAFLQEAGGRLPAGKRLDENADGHQPSEYTRCATRSRRPRSFRKPSMIFSNPGGIRETIQPVASSTTSPARVSSTFQSGGTTGHDGSTIAWSIRALIVRSVNANCSTPSPRSFRMRAFSSKPSRHRTRTDGHSAGRPSARTRRPAPGAADAILADDTEIVVARQRLLLLGRERREYVAKRARLDAHQLRIGVVAAHLALAAHHFARRPVEIDELREFPAAVVSA